MAGSSDGDDEGSFNTATWRIVLLFIGILIVDTVWEFVDEKITTRIRNHKHKGLLHAWEQLKFEVMALGLVSLLLVVFEEYLLKICIDKPQSQSEVDLKPTRRLQAVSADCPNGKEPIWSSDLIHKIHILIFLIAISHVLYAMCSLAISMHSVRKWRKYEEFAQSGELMDLPVAQLQREGEHKIWFGIRQGIRQFTAPIDKATYVALRRMFVDTMQVDDTFDFASFVTDFLTEEFSRIVKLEVLMWGIAILWIAFPDGSYAGFWMTGIFFLASIVAGSKLHVIAMHLARHAYALFYVPYGAVHEEGSMQHHSHDGKRAAATSRSGSGGRVRSKSAEGSDDLDNGVWPPQQKDSELAHMAVPEGEIGVFCNPRESAGAASNAGAKPSTSQLRRVSVPAAGARGAETRLSDVAEVPHEEHAARHGLSFSFRRPQPVAEAPEAAAPGTPKDVYVAFSHDAQRGQPIAEGDEGMATRSLSLRRVASGAPRRCASPPQEVYMSESPAAGGSSDPASGKQRTSSSSSAGAVAAHNEEHNSSDRASHERSSKRRLMPHLHPHHRPEMPMHMSCGCVPCLRHRRRVVRVQRADASEKKGVHVGVLGRDRKGRPNQTKVEFERLFWFRRPRLMLRVFQYAYFENALSLAVVIFGVWQHESTIFAGVGTSSSIQSAGFVASIVLIILDLMLLVHSSALVLPVYALTAASVHYQSPDAMLEFARKRNIRPDLIELLEADEEELDDGPFSGFDAADPPGEVTQSTAPLTTFSTPAPTSSNSTFTNGLYTGGNTTPPAAASAAAAPVQPRFSLARASAPVPGARAALGAASAVAAAPQKAVNAALGRKKLPQVAKPLPSSLRRPSAPLPAKYAHTDDAYADANGCGSEAATTRASSPGGGSPTAKPNLSRRSVGGVRSQISSHMLSQKTQDVRHGVPHLEQVMQAMATARLARRSQTGNSSPEKSRRSSPTGTSGARSPRRGASRAPSTGTDATLPQGAAQPAPSRLYRRSAQPSFSSRPSSDRETAERVCAAGRPEVPAEQLPMGSEAVRRVKWAEQQQSSTGGGSEAGGHHRRRSF